MKRHFAALVVLAGISLVAATPASGQERDFEKEARALGVDLKVYLDKSVKEEEATGNLQKIAYARRYRSSFDDAVRWRKNPRDLEFCFGPEYAGLAAGLRYRESNARRTNPGPDVPELTWERAQVLAERYTAHVDEMKRLAVLLYGQAGTTGEQAALFAKVDMSVGDSIALNERALERSRAMLVALANLQEQQEAAAQLQGPLIEALERYEGEVRPDIAKRPYGEHQDVLEVKVGKLSGIAQRLRAAPVTLPPRFDEMSHHLREFIPTLETALRIDGLRRTLGEDHVTDPAVMVAFERHVVFVEQWRLAQLHEWQVSQLPRFALPSDDASTPEGTAASAVRLASQRVAEGGQTAPSPAPAPAASPDPFREFFFKRGGLFALGLLTFVVVLSVLNRCLGR